jgi:hypothetical protein
LNCEKSCHAGGKTKMKWPQKLNDAHISFLGREGGDGWLWWVFLIVINISDTNKGLYTPQPLTPMSLIQQIKSVSVYNSIILLIPYSISHWQGIIRVWYIHKSQYFDCPFLFSSYSNLALPKPTGQCAHMKWVSTIIHPSINLCWVWCH